MVVSVKPYTVVLSIIPVFFGAKPLRAVVATDSYMMGRSQAVHEAGSIRNMGGIISSNTFLANTKIFPLILMVL